MSGPTPGPWMRWQGGELIVLESDPAVTIAAVHNERDALFIAAAPDMEEALETMLASCGLEFSAGGCDECDMGRAALAKARGEV